MSYFCSLTDDGERATSSLHAMSSSVPNPPSVLEKSMSPRTQHRHHKHRKRSPRGNTSPNLSSSPTTQTASTTSSSSSMLSESSSLSVDKQMEPDSRTVTETHSQTTGKHSGARKARSSPVEMNSRKSHSHNAAVAGTPSQKSKEKGGPGRGWVNIELPDSDSVQNAADDAGEVLGVCHTHTHTPHTHTHTHTHTQKICEQEYTAIVNIVMNSLQIYQFLLFSIVSSCW